MNVPFEDLEDLASAVSKAIVDAHPDVLLWEYDGGIGRHVFRDREFAEDALAEVIKRTVLGAAAAGNAGAETKA